MGERLAIGEPCILDKQSACKDGFKEIKGNILRTLNASTIAFLFGMSATIGPATVDVTPCSLESGKSIQGSRRTLKKSRSCANFSVSLFFASWYGVTHIDKRKHSQRSKDDYVDEQGLYDACCGYTLVDLFGFPRSRRVLLLLGVLGLTLVVFCARFSFPTFPDACVCHVACENEVNATLPECQVAVAVIRMIASRQTLMD